MSLQLKKVALGQCDYPSQPRSRLDPEHCRRLGESMRTHGQKVPIIGYSAGNRFVICDGGCRLEGARLVGLTELLALDLGKEPSRSDLLLAQASIDQHRQTLPPVDRARLFREILATNHWTARQLAESVQVSEAQISRALALLGLPEEVQRLVNEGTLDPSKAYVISQEADPARQVELARTASGLSRAKLAAQIRKPAARASAAPAVRLARVKLPLPGGVSIAVSGKSLSLEDLIEALSGTLEAARKANKETLDIRTFERVLRDKAKTGV